jgi:hypothetical protein
MQDMLGALPSWLSGIGGATEDMNWLNKLLAQVGGQGSGTLDCVYADADAETDRLSSRGTLSSYAIASWQLGF